MEFPKKSIYPLLYLVGLVILIYLFWNTPFLYPLKLLVVFFHESSHALATILTGGRVAEMVVVFQQGGHVLSQGGNRFIILNAGYLGSLLWGFLIYLVATFSRADKFTMMILGSSIGIITILFVRDWFTLLFGIMVATVMILSARYLHEKINDFVLRLIGLTSMIYVPLDIFSDTLQRSHLVSDARMLAEEYGGATLIWGGIWLLISIFLIVLCLQWTIRKPKIEQTELNHS